MKKFLGLLMAGALMLSLGACAEAEPPAEVPETQAAVQTETAGGTLLETGVPRPIGPMPEPLILRFRQDQRQEFDEETGTIPVLTFESSLPRAYCPGKPETEQKFNALFDEIERVLLEGEAEGEPRGLSAWLTEARAFQKELGEVFMPHSFSFTTQIERLDSKLLSFTVTGYAYTGGAHGSSFHRAFVLDSQTGEPVTLEALSAPGKNLSDWLLDAMTEKVTASQDYQDQMPWTEPENYREALSVLLADGSWYLDEEGLTLFSQEYQFGPHAAGVLEFFFPYGELNEWIGTEYGIEPYTDRGSLVLADPIGCNARILDDLYLDGQGEVMMLSARGTVRNVQIWKAGWQDGYYGEYPIWAAEEMEDCVLRIQDSIPDTIPNLMVRYEDGSGKQEALLTRSGETGELFLMTP